MQLCLEAALGSTLCPMGRNNKYGTVARASNSSSNAHEPLHVATPAEALELALILSLLYLSEPSSHSYV